MSIDGCARSKTAERAPRPLVDLHQVLVDAAAALFGAALLAGIILHANWQRIQRGREWRAACGSLGLSAKKRLLPAWMVAFPDYEGYIAGHKVLAKHPGDYYTEWVWLYMEGTPKAGWEETFSEDDDLANYDDGTLRLWLTPTTFSVDLLRRSFQRMVSAFSA